jgi:1-acyl-sn-glycerol-3-phosphate acyltransferase
MVQATLFFVTTILFLYVLDVRVIFRRIFWRRGLEPFLNIKAPRWGHGIVNLAKLLLALQHRDETARSIRRNLPRQFICLSNHQSYLDIVMIYDLFPAHQMRFVAKKALGKHFPGVSQTLRYQGHALIDQAGNARANHEIISRFARRCHQKGCCPAIFPEGTRSRTGELGSFQAAGLRMILDQGTLPLVVVAMDGGWEMATFKDYFGAKPKQLKVKILGVIPAPNTKDETRAALAKAREMIAAQLETWRAPQN